MKKDEDACVDSYDFEVQSSGEMRGCLQHFKYADDLNKDNAELNALLELRKENIHIYLTFTNKNFARKNLRCEK